MDDSIIDPFPNRALIISDEGFFFRHEGDDTYRAIDLDYNVGALEEFFTVPEDVHAESCPACDDIAAGTTSLSEEYPPGWKLVSCHRHARILNDITDNTRFVGGVRENSRAAATRYYKRQTKQKEQHKSTPTTSESTTIATATSAPPISTECAICLEAKPNIKIDCGHTFCSPCIAHWAEEQIDHNLAEWFEECPDVLIEFPILKHHAKSRYTCPMCRYHGQHTKQSRRGKKTWNNVTRGLPPIDSSRGRRGGQRRRRVREAHERATVEGATIDLPRAPPSMPLVTRLPPISPEVRSTRRQRVHGRPRGSNH